MTPLELKKKLSGFKTREEKLQFLSSMPEADKLQVIAEAQNTFQGRPIEQKMPEKLSILTRARAKAYGDSPQEQMNVINAQQPNTFETAERPGSGQVLVAQPGQETWNVLDPEGRDIGDVADVGAEGVKTAGALGAGTLGAVLGGLSPVPGGTLMGGALGTMLGEGGLELVRQKLGQMAGTGRPEIDYKQALKDAVVSGALHTGLGGGATQGQINDWLRLFGKSTPEASNLAAVQAINAGQRGLISRGIPTGVEILSGANAQIIDRAGPAVARTRDLEKQGHLDFATKATKDIVDTVDEARRLGGKEYEDFLASSDYLIPTDDYIGPYLEAEARLQQRYTRTKSPKVKEQLDYLQKEIKPHLMREVTDDAGNVTEVFMDVIHPIDALALRQDMKNLAETHRMGLVDRFTGKSPGKAEVMRTTTAIERNIGRDLDKIAVTPEGKHLAKEYADLREVTDFVGRKFKDDETTMRTLMTAGNKNKQVVQEKLLALDQRFPQLQLGQKIRTLEDYSLFHDPSWSARSSKGGTSTGRSGVAATLGGGLGYALGGATGIPFAAPTMAALGATTMGALSSPAAIRKAYELGLPQVGGYAADVARRTALPIGLWNYLEGQNNGR